MKALHITSVTGEDWLERIARLRVEVWRHHDMIDPGAFPDGRCREPVDDEARHFVVTEGKELLGAVRYIRYPDLASTHLGSYYREAGIELSGSIVVPEHLVVHPRVAGHSLHALLADALVQRCIDEGVSYMISECAPAAAALMKKRGRRSLGPAPEDPRFPGIVFEWILSDIGQIKAQER